MYVSSNYFRKTKYQIGKQKFSGFQGTSISKNFRRRKLSLNIETEKKNHYLITRTLWLQLCRIKVSRKTMCQEKTLPINKKFRNARRTSTFKTLYNETPTKKISVRNWKKIKNKNSLLFRIPWQKLGFPEGCEFPSNGWSKILQI